MRMELNASVIEDTHGGMYLTVHLLNKHTIQVSRFGTNTEGYEMTQTECYQLFKVAPGEIPGPEYIELWSELGSHFLIPGHRVMLDGLFQFLKNQHDTQEVLLFQGDLLVMQYRRKDKCVISYHRARGVMDIVDYYCDANYTVPYPFPPQRPSTPTPAEEVFSEVCRRMQGIEKTPSRVNPVITSRYTRDDK